MRFIVPDIPAFCYDLDHALRANQGPDQADEGEPGRIVNSAVAE